MCLLKEQCFAVHGCCVRSVETSESWHTSAAINLSLAFLYILIALWDFPFVECPSWSTLGALPWSR
jgi:hypothetical protein